MGQQKPRLVGLKDVRRPQNNFLPSEMTVCSPEAVFFGTGKLAANTDLQDLPAGEQIDQKFNEFVVFDEAQVRLRYLVQFSYSYNN